MFGSLFGGTPIRTEEMDKLERGLKELGLSYDRHPLYNGEQITCEGWDAVCHSGSYGHEEGLLEIYGNIVRVTEDSVEGWLTAEEILQRLR